jgi:hypothetical protein
MARRPCLVRGCAGYAEGGASRCPAHTAEERWTNGGTRAWRRLRKRALTRDRHTCRAHGCDAPAVEVHHLTPGPDVLVALDDLASLCREHHNATRRGEHVVLDEPPRWTPTVR